jgi:hypothetical protein
MSHPYNSTVILAKFHRNSKLILENLDHLNEAVLDDSQMIIVTIEVILMKLHASNQGIIPHGQRIGRHRSHPGLG